jgi:hypothetical protein
MSAPCKSLDPAQCLDPVRFLQYRHGHRNANPGRRGWLSSTRERTLMKFDAQPRIVIVAELPHQLLVEA